MIDAIDFDGDGGGYDGDTSECAGSSSVGAGDITPAMQSCGGTCSTDGRVCLFSNECRLCIGGANAGMVCTSGSNCPDGTCPAQTGITCNGAHDTCRVTISGHPVGGSACNIAEPSRCIRYDGINPGNYFPPGLWCEHAFQDKCDAEWILNGITGHGAVDLSVIYARFGMVTDVNEETPDFQPTYLGTLVLDVPSNAKGSYRIDINDDQTILCENYDISCPDGPMPIAALNEAVIRVVSCSTGADCNDDNACTVDACVDACECTHTPIAGWDPAAECCHPTTGVQAPIPGSTPCRVGGCSLGGNSGTPTLTSLPDGTACNPEDRCFQTGQCVAGTCDGEEFAGPNCLKSRFISFLPQTGSASSAYRVRLVSLHHPDPPYRAGVAADFSAFEGEYRWVGPFSTYVESSVNPTPVYAAVLGCDPHYANWLFFDLLHVTGSEVVPSSVYELQWIREGFDINNEANYSFPIVLQTDAWGDVFWPYSPPGSTIQPDASDLTEVIDKFKGLVGSISKPRAVMSGANGSDIPDLNLDVDFGQVSANVDAFRGKPYPYAGPAPCP